MKFSFFPFPGLSSRGSLVRNNIPVSGNVRGKGLDDHKIDNKPQKKQQIETRKKSSLWHDLQRIFISNSVI